jgi:hypothetical protein
MRKWYNTYDDEGNLVTFMCCLCFESVGVDSAWVCSHGIKWDNCIPCGENDGCEHLIHDRQGE